MTGTAMSQWTSVFRVDDLGEGNPPIIYQGPERLPRRTDDRGGMFYVDTPESASHDFLRVGVVTDDLRTATVVLDRSQVIALAARLYEWLGHEVDSKALNRATGEARPWRVIS